MPALHPMTLHAILDAYVSWLAANRAASTAAVRRSIFASLKRHIRDKPAGDVRPRDIDRWVQKTQTKASTRHGYITAVIGAFSWGLKFGHLEMNPIAGMPKPTPTVRQDFLPASKFPALLVEAKTVSDAFHDAVLMLLDTGCRVEELVRFRASHLNEAQDRLTLFIPQSKGRRRSRVVFLPPAARKLVRTLAAEHPTGRLFLNSQRTPWTSTALGFHFRAVGKKMGLDFSLCGTALRHSFTYARLEAGQDVSTVAKLLGHTTSKMVETRYGHLDGSELLAKKAAEVQLV